LSRELYRFAVTVTAGTAKAAPSVAALKMPDRTISRVVVAVPPGPHGLVGFQLASGGLQMIPLNAGQFVTADNEVMTWDLDGYISSGAWQMIAYNTGAFDHTLEVRFEASPVALATAPAGFQPIPNSALDSGSVS